MDLREASKSALNQLYQIVREVDKEKYSKPLESLNGSTIGQHVRHTLEFYICLLQGLPGGQINYDSRERETRIETEPGFACDQIKLINDQISSVRGNNSVTLEGSYSTESDETSFQIPSNFERELAYNIEHAVHHMAIIKIGLNETHPDLALPPDFGVAVSTVRYHN